jgi:hypothetical protein
VPFDACPTCGLPVENHDRDVRFTLPDPVLGLVDAGGLPEGSWLSHDDPDESVMLLVPELGAFVRCLLPLRLEGGHTITFGVWVGVSSEDLQRAWSVWWEPEYADLELTGVLANALPGVDVLAAPVVVRVRDAEETPYVDSSSDTLLAQVLADEWPHAQVLDLLQ